MEKETQKVYNIPVNWVQSGTVTIKSDTLQGAIDKMDTIELSSLGLIGQTVPSSTRVSYPLLRDLVQDEVLADGITLFTSTKVPDCPFCEKAREFFTKNNLEIKEVSIDLDENEAKRVFARTNNMALPQIEFGNEIFIGFQEPRIHAALVRYGILEAPSAPTDAAGATPPSNFKPPSPPAVTLDPPPVPAKDDPPAAVPKVDDPVMHPAAVTSMPEGKDKQQLMEDGEKIVRKNREAALSKEKTTTPK